MKKNDKPEVDDGIIHESLYDRIVRCMPIPTVEALVVRNNSLLFLKRSNAPAKGQWWFPGGRIRKGETLEEALFREVIEETGLHVTSYRLVNVYSRVFPERHDITVAFLCKCRRGKVVLNEEHSEHKFFKDIPMNVHPYLLRTIHDSSWSKHC
jgi:ADP-ribose pyrophosphatase YjhB (NUDIX family)